MPINVVCPGCLKRFQVSDRFAGLKGPCPNCNTVINIPKAEVKIHGAEEFDQGGKTTQGKLILKPIERLDMDFNPMRAAVGVAVVLLVCLAAVLLGRSELSVGTKDLIGAVGLFLIAFPLSLFGAYMMRDREELFVLTGLELYQKAAICAGAYALLWILFESVAWYMNADEIFVWIYFAAFVGIAAFVAQAVLDLNFGQAVLHALIFFVSVIFLRGLMGLGWLWIAFESVRRGNTPPPPIL